MTRHLLATSAAEVRVEEEKFEAGHELVLAEALTRSHAGAAGDTTADLQQRSVRLALVQTLNRDVRRVVRTATGGAVQDSSGNRTATSQVPSNVLGSAAALPTDGHELLPEAGAERTLEAVGSRLMLDAVSRCLRVRPRFSLCLGTSVPFRQRSSLPLVMGGDGYPARQIPSPACPPDLHVRFSTCVTPAYSDPVPIRSLGSSL